VIVLHMFFGRTSRYRASVVCRARTRHRMGRIAVGPCGAHNGSGPSASIDVRSIPDSAHVLRRRSPSNAARTPPNSSRQHVDQHCGNQEAGGSRHDSGRASRAFGQSRGPVPLDTAVASATGPGGGGARALRLGVWWRAGMRRPFLRESADGGVFRLFKRRGGNIMVARVLGVEGARGRPASSVAATGERHVRSARCATRRTAGSRRDEREAHDHR
jgi:hypothetical protein